MKSGFKIQIHLGCDNCSDEITEVVWVLDNYRDGELPVSNKLEEMKSFLYEAGYKTIEGRFLCPSCANHTHQQISDSIRTIQDAIKKRNEELSQLMKLQEKLNS